jgi:hypothetical protein
MPRDNPAMLVDSRVNVIRIDSWKKEMVIWWRVFDGDEYNILEREIKLPGW